MGRLLALALLVVSALVASCGPQGEIDPIPTPLAMPNGDLLLFSASSSLREAGMPGSSGMVAILGAPEAIQPGVRVVVENLAGAFAVEARVNDDGSFATALPAAASDELRVFARLRREGESPVDGPAYAWRVAPQEEGQNPPVPIEYLISGGGVPTRAITATVDDDGHAVVVALAETTEPGVEVVVGNVSLSAMVSTRSETDGSFEVRVPARRGDLLAIFARWADAPADDPTASSESITIPVQ